MRLAAYRTLDACRLLCRSAPRYSPPRPYLLLGRTPAMPGFRIMRGRIGYCNGELFQPLMYGLTWPQPMATPRWLNTWWQRTTGA